MNLGLGFGIVFAVVPSAIFSLSSQAKTFQNSYVSFELPDTWKCVQEGVAWTCDPQGPSRSKEAVIVLTAKVAGPEDNLDHFLTYLKEPKKLITDVGTPMPSQAVYARETAIGGDKWIEAQHIGSEIPDYTTLYLATVKSHLALLLSFRPPAAILNSTLPSFTRPSRPSRSSPPRSCWRWRIRAPKSGWSVIGSQIPRALSPPPPTGSSTPEKGPVSARSIGLGLAALILAIATIWRFFSARSSKFSNGKRMRNRPK